MAAAAAQQGGVLRVLTFTGTTPFVVRCERDTRVKDIVGAIAEIWGFKEAARLFTLCRPAPGSDSNSDPHRLLPGTLLSWNDRPCEAAPSAAGSDNSHASTSTGASQPPPLLLVRYIFGSMTSEWEQNHSVLSLTAAQIAADVTAGRYPGVAEAGLYQHWVKQNQHSVVIHMASSWPSGACLIVGPAHVLSGGAALNLGNTPINLGINSKGMHILMPQQHKLQLPLESISSATPAGDVLNISFSSAQPDLLLQLPGAEAVAEAFRVHKEASSPCSSTTLPAPESSVSSAPGSGPASSKRAGLPVQPLWITSPSVERWLSEPTPKDDSQPVSVSIQVLRPWEQTPPVLRVLLTTEQQQPDERLVEAQLLVVDEEEPEDSSDTVGSLPAANGNLSHELLPAADGQTAKAGKQKQQRVKLQLRVCGASNAAPEPRVKLTIAPVPQVEQELLMPAAGDEPLVRLVIKPRGERPVVGSSPLTMLRLLHKGSAAAGQQPTGTPGPSNAGAEGALWRGSDERPVPHLMQRLQQQQQQQQEVRQGLLAGPHLGGTMAVLGAGQGAGMRPAYGNRPTYGGGYRPNMGSAGATQHQGATWGQQQYGTGMVARPAGMRPLGASTVPHQPYTLVGPPNTMMAPQQAAHRPAMVPGGASGAMQPMQARVRPQPPQHYPGQMHVQQQQQQHVAGLRQPQQQVALQQGGYMVMQQQSLPQQGMMQQPAQLAYATPPQQPPQPPPQQQPQQHFVMMQGGMTPTASNSNMVLVTTADGRQLLVPENQLQQAQQPQQLQQLQQQQLTPGVFMVGPHGDLVPAGAQVAADNAGMQQVLLQQPQPPPPQQQQPMLLAQQQGQPMFVQASPSQRLQQQMQAQQMQSQQMQAQQMQAQQMQAQQMQAQQMQLLQPQAQRQMGAVGGMVSTGYEQLGLSGMTQPLLLQGQPMGLLDLNTGQVQLQPQQQPHQQQQQQYIAVSGGVAGPHTAQLLQLQSMTGMSTAMAAAPQGLYMPVQQQQQQQGLLVAGGAAVSDNSMGLLQQQLQRGMTGPIMASAAMFGGPGMTSMGFLGQSGPSSGGGAAGGLGFGQQGLGAGAAPGLSGIGAAVAPGLQANAMGDAVMSSAGMGMGGLGLAAGGASYLNSFDPTRQPNSHNSLDTTGLGVGSAAGAASADPPGLNYGGSGTRPGAFLQPQQQQGQQQPMFAVGTAGMGGVAGLGAQDGLAMGLQGAVLQQDAYMLANSGMAITGAAPGLEAPGCVTSQHFNTPGFY